MTNKISLPSLQLTSSTKHIFQNYLPPFINYKIENVCVCVGGAGSSEVLEELGYLCIKLHGVTAQKVICHRRDNLKSNGYSMNRTTESVVKQTNK